MINLPSERQLAALSERDPVGLANWCGQAMSLLPTYTINFSQSYAINLAKKTCLVERLDYLISVPAFIPRDKRIIETSLGLSSPDEGGILLEDKSRSFGSIAIHIEKEPNAMAFRIEEPNLNWWLEKQDDEIFLTGQSNGWSKFDRTRQMILFVKWTSNLLGFDRSKG